ncbi:coproporphyrinogen III oxidase [Platysternon megacephalum]|uniref:Coproporphyrinogen III oxidase n=1 Tax=Platysternon megacephalum TaxID=55544 RepID=A0A4D9DCB5_9SAUR|nr:coproporphyrinogen III oxidase [Platysternon megacephalum]
MTSRARSFGIKASAYERYRPGYPDEVANLVLSYAGKPLHTALEIGAGTGKATRVFSTYGLNVTVVEPDPAMVTELRAAVPSYVEVLDCAFEDVPLGTTYDLVYAAASFHWTEPEGRWTRLASMLPPGGIFASFGGPVELVDHDLVEAIRDARVGLMGEDTDSQPHHAEPAPGALRWPGDELFTCGLFTDVREITVPRRFTMTSEEYLGLLTTVSSYLALPPVMHEVVFDRIAAVLPAEMDVNADITLHLARRR